MSKLLATAANAIDNTPPDKLAAGLSGSLAFLAGLLLLSGALGDAAAGNQTLITALGAIIAAVLASQLAAYVVRLVTQRAAWLTLSRPRQLAVIFILSLAAAAVVLVLMLLVS